MHQTTHGPTQRCLGKPTKTGRQRDVHTHTHTLHSHQISHTLLCLMWVTKG